MNGKESIMTFEDLLNDEPYKSCYNKGFADGKAKGRADAIKETLNKVTKRMSDYLEFDDVKIDWDLFCEEMKEIAEQLKEQNNE